MAVLLRIPAIPFPLRNSSRHSSTGIRMALNTHKNTNVSFSTTRKLPILLFDIMDTIVRDPFYHDIPAFFRMPFEELIESKHPTAWIEFEKGLIDERDFVMRILSASKKLYIKLTQGELAKIFFKDGRPLDLEGLKNCMREGYSYIDGVEKLLHVLKQNNYEMHAFTNYPIWYEMIEDKLNVSKYLSWTFCSCINGKRKPDPEFFLEVVRHLKVDPGSCIFVDDRKINVDAAKDMGIIGLQFKNADVLRQDLSLMGIDITAD